MDDDAFDIDIEVTRKPDPEQPPSYECAACQKKIQPRAFFWDREFRSGPICRSCCQFWARSTWVRAIHRKRRDPVMKLAALINCFEWEVLNAGRRY